MVHASRAWKYSQTRCMTFLKWQTTVSMESTVSTGRCDPRHRPWHTPMQRPHRTGSTKDTCPKTLALWHTCCGAPVSERREKSWKLMPPGDMQPPWRSCCTRRGPRTYSFALFTGLTMAWTTSAERPGVSLTSQAPHRPGDPTSVHPRGRTNWLAYRAAPVAGVPSPRAHRPRSPCMLGHLSARVSRTSCRAEGSGQNDVKMHAKAESQRSQYHRANLP